MGWLILILAIIGLFIPNPIYWVILAIVATGWLISRSIERSSIRQAQVAAAIQERNEQLEFNRQNNYDVPDYVDTTPVTDEDWITASSTPVVKTVGGIDWTDRDKDDEVLFNKVVSTVIETRKASTSLLQRRFRIGYAKSSHLIDKMERQGIIGPADGVRPREVLMTKAAYEEKLAKRKKHQRSLGT